MRNLNLRLLTFIVVGSLLITSCETNDTVDLSEPISADETVALTEVDDISDDVDNIIDDYFVESEDFSKTSEIESKTEDLLPCVVKTFVLTDTTKTVTLDFGEGCELPNGNVLSGKIIMNYVIDTDVNILTIAQTYENFYFNDISIEGENTIVRIRENENGNPQSTVTFGTTITWPDGVSATREGFKVREWIEGYDTRDWADNVFLFTGSWTLTFTDGIVYSSSIIEPLRREMACRFIVSGIVEVQKLDMSGTIDFGDGSCDDIATFTDEDGVVSEITLGCRIAG